MGRILLGEPPVTPANTRNPACPTLPGSRGVAYAGVECPSADRELVALVLAARAGDSSAWTELLGRFDRTLRSIAGSCRLAPADVDDVVQATWLDLLRDIERVREPAGIAGWLGTATRRKALRLAKRTLARALTMVWT